MLLVQEHNWLLRSQALAAIYGALGKEIYYHGDKPSTVNGSIIRDGNTVDHISYFAVYDAERDVMVTYRYTVQATVVVSQQEVAVR